MKLIREIWSILVIFIIAIVLAPGVRAVNGLYGYVVSGLIYSAMIIFLPNIIKFFKVNVNFWSFLLFGIFVSIGYFYIMKYIFIGFLTFDAFLPSQALFGLGFLRGISLSLGQVIVVDAIFTMILTTVNKWILDN